MPAKSFQTADEMAEYQAQRELNEAMRVQAMSPAERYQWLADNWGRLQDEGSALFSGGQETPATARCYASMEEKNLFDEAREVELALRRTMHWG